MNRKMMAIVVAIALGAGVVSGILVHPSVAYADDYPCGTMCIKGTYSIDDPDYCAWTMHGEWQCKFIGENLCYTTDCPDSGGGGEPCDPDVCGPVQIE